MFFLSNFSEAQKLVEDMEKERRKLDKQLDVVQEKTKRAYLSQEILEAKMKVVWIIFKVASAKRSILAIAFVLLFFQIINGNRHRCYHTFLDPFKSAMQVFTSVMKVWESLCMSSFFCLLPFAVHLQALFKSVQVYAKFMQVNQFYITFKDWKSFQSC